MKMVRKSLVIFAILGLGLALGCSRDPNVKKQKYMESGKRYYDGGKYREAMIQYSNALQVDPRYADAHYELAMALIRQGKQAEAVPKLTEALRHDPNHVDAHYQLGMALLRRNKLMPF